MKSLKAKLTGQNLSSFLKELKEKYGIKMEQEESINTLLSQHHVQLQKTLKVIEKKVPPLLERGAQASATINHLIDIASKFDDEEGLEDFLKVFGLYASVYNSRSENADLFFEDLTLLAERPEDVKLFLEIGKSLSISIEDLLSKDTLSLRYLLESVNILKHSKLSNLNTTILVENINQYQKEQNYNKSRIFFPLYTHQKEALFVRLCILKSLLLDTRKTSLLTKYNLEALFDEKDQNKNEIVFYSTLAMQQFFAELIDAERKRSLTQIKLNELIKNLKVDKGVQKYLKVLSIEQIAEHFTLEIDDEMRESYEAFGDSWWVKAFYGYFPSNLLRTLKWYDISLALTREDILPICALEIIEIQSFLDSVHLIHKQDSLIHQQDEKTFDASSPESVAIFRDIVSLKEKCSFVELYKALKMTSSVFPKYETVLSKSSMAALIKRIDSLNNVENASDFLALFDLLLGKKSGRKILSQENINILLSERQFPLLEDKEKLSLLKKIMEQCKEFTKGSTYLQQYYSKLFQQESEPLHYILKIIEIFVTAQLDDRSLRYALHEFLYHYESNPDINTAALSINYLLLAALNNSQLLSEKNFNSFFEALKRKLAISYRNFKIAEHSPLLTFIPKIILSASNQTLTQSELDEALQDINSCLQNQMMVKPNYLSFNLAGLLQDEKLRGLDQQSLFIHTKHFFQAQNDPKASASGKQASKNLLAGIEPLAQLLSLPNKKRPEELLASFTVEEQGESSRVYDDEPPPYEEYETGSSRRVKR